MDLECFCDAISIKNSGLQDIQSLPQALCSAYDHICLRSINLEESGRGTVGILIEFDIMNRVNYWMRIKLKQELKYSTSRGAFKYPCCLKRHNMKSHC